ncbi:MAG: helix-turn-helix domain-containing protein [Dehalococcoidia bacterium]|nr:helix-turn-helix domain-containing protein [Dehalococcoidia bacterium]MDP6227006.1 helix-turn-helix domain-containing protein [Dehalococcoidia bacterium]MDP7083135.1 helix-turn-helix domain-containing protein [Dehalococcoidia bacterium]MDP7201704.1 helix-turn-helix domain-containing protein [Dehalococcoidia bacterium]MDP7509313.1 helix-turn-helix domain-containing protein [Dehalococcoidia bacterium]
MVAIHQPAEFLPIGLKMLTVSEAANLLGAHINSVRRWADMGLLPSYRIGLRGDRRFRPEEISSFLTSQRQG